MNLALETICDIWAKGLLNFSLSTKIVTMMSTNMTLPSLEKAPVLHLLLMTMCKMLSFLQTV